MWGFMILFGIILFWIVFYWYFFVHSLVNIQFQSNISDYNIRMDSTQKKYEQACSEANCIIPNVSPFEYSITIEKEGYKTLEYTYKPSKKTATQDILLEKDYKLKSVELFSQKEATTLLEGQENELTIQEKIELLKTKKTIFYTVKTEENNYIFKKNVNWLELFQNDKFLWNFKNSTKSEIKLLEIIWNKNYLFLELWENKYLFQIQSGENKKVTFEIPINYIKSGNWNGEFIFVTQKGSFLYNSYENKFSYNAFFSDYVIFQKNTYVWIIYSNEINKKQKFNLDEKSGNIILQYSPETKEQIVLIDTSKNIIKIFKKDWEIYFQDADKNYFSLTHLQEK